MKSPVLIGLVLLAISCQNEGSYQKESFQNDLKGYELIFDESSGISPLIDRQGVMDLSEEELDKVIMSVEDSVFSIIKKINPNLSRETIEISVFNEIAVYFASLSQSDLKQFESQSEVNHFQVEVDIDLQGRRPMMQSSLITQGRRPMMQEQMRYDSLKQTSLFIEDVGGGVPVSTIPNTRVWIIDSGIDSAHQDIVFRNPEVRLSRDFTKNNQPSQKNPFMDGHGHGTQIAGIIGAKSSSDPSQYGMNGVFPQARMVSLKIFNGNGRSSFGKLFKALDYVSRKAKRGDIVNLSLGFTVEETMASESEIQIKIQRLEKKIKDLIDVKLVHVVMSAGNEADLSTRNLPGGLILSSPLAHTIASYGNYYDAPSNSSKRLFSFFSNYGTPTIDYIEPGEYIFTTGPGNSYVVVSGTSFSASIFSGILYHGTNFDTLGAIYRGPDSNGKNPPYPIAKVR